MNKLNSFLILVVVLSSENMTKAQIPTFTLIDTSIVCTIGGFSNGSAFGDFNNDGLEDLIIDNACQSSGPCSHFLFLNEGDWNFIPVNEGDIVNYISAYGSHGSCWGDYNNDGYLDLFIASIKNENNLLFMNNGDGSFTKINEGAIVNDGGDSGPPSWVDINNDGDGNFTSDTSSYWVNDHAITWSACWGDYDNDGYMDLFLPTRGAGGTAKYDLLYHNNGDGTFEKITSIASLDQLTINWGAQWADLDNDGYLDLFTTEDDKNYFIRNNGDGTFTKTESDIGGCIVDMNNDGFLDMFQVRGYDNSPPYENLIYANDGNSNSWITIKLVGSVSNKSAIGARVRTKANIGGSSIWQIGEIGMSWTGLYAHFGFGDATLIDSLIVQWPAGHDTVLTNVDVNQFLTITEEIPAGYLSPSFAVDTTVGRGELTVQFNDISMFDTGNPITSWSWDLNGDGNEDSDEQDPIFVYSNNEGEVYDVSLTISNGIDSATVTRKECIRIYPKRTENLAQWGIAIASSLDGPVFTAQNAIDGEMLSRWGSEWTNYEWLKVEMDSVYEIGKVVIHWEAAYARKYEIQSSLDDSEWETVYCEDAGDGLEDTIYFTGTSAKYVKLMCLQRISIYGYSVYEFEIYRSDGNEYDDNCPTGIINHSKSDDKISVYPNPFNESVTFSFNLVKPGNIELDIYDLLGRNIVNVYNGSLKPGHQSIVWDRKNNSGLKVKSGYYIYNLKIGDGLKSKGKLLIMD